MDCNFVGTDAWLTALTDGLVGTPYANFSSRPRAPWTREGGKGEGGGIVAGTVRSVGKLTQVLVYGAGHLVPMDQPAAALTMVEGFVAAALGGHV